MARLRIAVQQDDGRALPRDEIVDLDAVDASVAALDFAGFSGPGRRQRRGDNRRRDDSGRDAEKGDSAEHKTDDPRTDATHSTKSDFFEIPHLNKR